MFGTKSIKFLSDNVNILRFMYVKIYIEVICVKFIICDDYNQVSKEAAAIMAAQIKKNSKSVLGLATGSTPVGMYKELIEMNKKGEISFKDIVTYNLDEYYPISPDNNQSYRYFMNENLFNHIDIDKNTTHVLNGLADDPEKECADFDKAVEEAGFVDLQVLGIGRNGHIAFNEPDSTLYAGTHVTGLTQSTIEANSRFFDSIDQVPTKALTMGIGSILKAQQIIILISGKDKKDALDKLRDEFIDPQCPATMLKAHRNVTVICDKEAWND